MLLSCRNILKILTLDTKRHGVTFSYLATQSTNLEDKGPKTFVGAIQDHPKVNFCCKKMFGKVFAIFSENVTV